jgi:prophage DNA circulation protein
MAWDDRLREAAYTSPSGNRLTFDYENVSKKRDKKTTAFDFVDADGTYIQESGNAGRQFPLRIFFSGDNCDREADAFDAALLERGVGTLSHPRYGVAEVVPFGTITQRDDLKTAANQVVIEVTFWETIRLIYPAAQVDPASAALFAVGECNVALSEQFGQNTSLDSAVESATFKSGYKALLDTVSGGLEAVAEVQDDVEKEFNEIVDSINSGIDILIARPLTLAFQTAILIQAPARALAAIGARLDAYKNLAKSITSGDDAVAAPAAPGGTTAPAADARVSNLFHTRDLFASSYVTGSVVSVINNQFSTKTEALSAAVAVLDQLDEVTQWRDDNFAALLEIDTGGAYQKLQEAVALTAGFLVEISFTLKQERRVVLTRDRTIIDLVAEFYGEVDDRLDFFIDSNSLTGSEILEVPRGREIVYYI